MYVYIYICMCVPSSSRSNPVSRDNSNKQKTILHVFGSNKRINPPASEAVEQSACLLAREVFCLLPVFNYNVVESLVALHIPRPLS